jgi:hypothetical protein
MYLIIRLDLLSFLDYIYFNFLLNYFTRKKYYNYNNKQNNKLIII